MFIFYWCVTILFTIPDNYINLSLPKHKEYFDFYLFQKSAFFAPPPTFNDKLYYVFKSSKTDSITIYEALYPIIKKKRRKAPFNTNEDLLDYVLSNSVNNIYSEMNDFRDNCNYIKQRDKTKDTMDCVLESIEYVEQSYTFLTLKNYSNEIMKTNNVKSDFDSVRLIISQVPIPKFQDRYNAQSVKESYGFISKFHKIK